jgi:hypothetical protein
MSPLQDEVGLVLLLASAVLFGVVTLGAASLMRARRAMPCSVRRPDRTDGQGLIAGLSDNRPPATLSPAGDATRQSRQSQAATIVSRAAATAPTDAHMSLRVGFDALRWLLRRLLRLHS